MNKFGCLRIYLPVTSDYAHMKRRQCEIEYECTYECKEEERSAKESMDWSETRVEFKREIDFGNAK